MAGRSNGQLATACRGCGYLADWSHREAGRSALSRPSLGADRRRRDPCHALAALIAEKDQLPTPLTSRGRLVRAFSSVTARSQTRKLAISGQSAVPSGAISQSPEPVPSVTLSQRYPG